MTEQTLPDFQKLVSDYRQKLSNGQRADLRRAEEPDALLDMPVFYRLIQSDGMKANLQAARVIYFLSYVEHKKGAKSIGRLMQDEGVNEKRLFQIIRSESPEDLIYLRRLAQQLKPTVDWQDFGRMLFYWGKNTKRQLLQDFYLSPQKD